MPRIDAHQHFWKYDPVRDSWITGEMAVIRRDFGPSDLHPILQLHNFDGCVAVQADQSEVENDLLLDYASRYDFIKGVVGWVDLRAENVEERLEHYTQFSKLKGFRHVLQGEADRALMLRPEFKRGIRLLQRLNYTYDILIFPDQLKYAAELVAAFPEQLFVVDHLAKPYIKDGKINKWKRDLRALATHGNVWCKVSGMVTEADWKHWEQKDFTPYLEVVVEAFGTDRLLYGSDWPVCMVAATYGQALEVVQNYFSSFSQSEQEAIFSGNAIKFYKLD